MSLLRFGNYFSSSPQIYSTNSGFCNCLPIVLPNSSQKKNSSKGLHVFSMENYLFHGIVKSFKNIAKKYCREAF
jgi:hypothetical protein